MTLLYPQVLVLFLALLWLYQSTNKRAIKLYISLAFMIIALTRPVVINQQNNESIKAKDLIIALDVSSSMNADDIKPTRLNVAKKLIGKILETNKQDRFSLFAFTTNPLILSPSTTDHQLLISAIDSLKVDNILTHGTNLQNLLNRISVLKIPQKNLLLFSDGGDSFDIEQLLDICQENGIHIFAIGTATNKGATLKDSYGKKIKDTKKNLVISRLNPQLKDLAQQSGGEFFKIDDFDFLLGFIEQERFSKKQNRSFSELFWIPLLIGVILFWINFVKIPKKILLLIPFLSLHSDANLLDWYYIDKANDYYHQHKYKEAVENFSMIEHKTMQSQLNLANSYYQLESYKKARSIYKNLKSTDKRVKKIIFYKLGNCEAKLKKYKKAREYYKKALSFGKDNEILYNLRLISFKKDKNRRDFPAFHSKDKAKEDTPQGSKSKKSKPKQDSKTKKTEAKVVKPSFKRPLGFKAYELINKGYIDEKQPW
jgi:Ca-activated chloride channel family protein